MLVLPLLLLLLLLMLSSALARSHAVA